MSAFLGDQEVMEQSESISFGAHQMRDGVNLSPHKTFRPLVPFSDLMNLSNLVAYLKLPRNLPLTMLTFDYCSLPLRNLAFVSKAKSMQSTYTRPNEKDLSPSVELAPSADQGISPLSDIQEKKPFGDDIKTPVGLRDPY